MMESASMKVVIDDRPVEVRPGMTILAAAQQAGLHIPHLCFHPAFVPEGSCRICLVEIEGLPKLELACATTVRDGMKISTQSPRVREARRGVLEFLLADHPLDCPICDKAGECKLQDYYLEYGLFENAFKEAKEKREKIIKIGEKLILDRERCILCTRCVRFLSEITKTQELGVFRRGIYSEISTYEGAPVKNNYSGNLVDLCPVGAITDREFRFKTRTWFLVQTESICPL
jgi:NADH-quinone oxidoreductase subunit G